MLTKHVETLGMIFKSFNSNDPDVILPLYNAYVRSTLEFGSLIWCPYRKKYSTMIESVQRRRTKRLANMKSLQYKDRLQRLNMYTLQTRRLRYELIFLYKIVNNLVNVKFDDFFQYSPSLRTRGNRFKILYKHCNHDYRLYFFTCDIVSYWNKLTDDEIEVKSVPIFKSVLKSFFCRNNIW